MIQICGAKDVFSLIILIVFFLGPAIVRILGAKPGEAKEEGKGTVRQGPTQVKRHPARVSAEAQVERPSPVDPDSQDQVLIPSLRPKPAPSRPRVARVRRAVPTAFPAPSDAQITRRADEPGPGSQPSYGQRGKQVPAGKTSLPIIALLLDKDPLVNGLIYSEVLGKPKGLEKPDYESRA